MLVLVQVRIYNLETGAELTGLTIEEKCGITSIFVSQDQRHLLLNLNQQRIHLHELGDPATNSPSPSAGAGPVQKYVGSQEQKGRFVVRSCLGGINQAFVLSGSEDCKVRHPLCMLWSILVLAGASRLCARLSYRIQPGLCAQWL